MSDKYSTLYDMNFSIVLNRNEYIQISSSDIVSLSFIHNYDTATFPIIRLRLYCDLSIIQSMLEFPDDIYVRANINGGIYKVRDSNSEVESPICVAGVSPISFEMKGYVENKNIPTSVMDQYDMGLKKNDDLNTNVKSPIEIYCYDEKLLHMMQQKSESVYKKISLTSVIQDMLTRNNVRSYDLQTLDNQTKYDQILIPNLNIIDAISFFDIKYGLYHKGGQMYGDYDKLWICDSDVNNGQTPIPIYVRGYKDNDDTTGMMKTSSNQHKYQMVVNTPNVSVITETDIERVLNSPEMGAINLNTLDINIEKLKKLFSTSMVKSSSRKTSNGIISDIIDTPQILHKNNSDYVLPSYIARLDEKITRIDVSGSGFDIGRMRINSRYNVIFESPIRGWDINAAYRATYICHVLTNMDGSLFSATTTMSLCTN